MARWHEWRPIGYLALVLAVVAGGSLYLQRRTSGPSPAAGCVDAASGWGIPLCLCDGQPAELAALKLPRAVDTLAWLHEPVESIDIEGSAVTELGALPASVRKVRAAGAAVGVVSSLGGIESLDLSRSNLRKAAELPASSSLHSLTVSDIDLSGLAGRFPELKELSLELQRREILDLMALPRGLKTLSLSAFLQGGVRSLERIPAGLKELTLSVPRTQLVDLPPTLDRLKVVGPVDFEPEELPGDVTEVTLVGYRPKARLADVFPYLSTLEVHNVRVADLSELPRFLTRLTLQGTHTESLDDLPPALVRLSITQPDLMALEPVDHLQHLISLSLPRWNGTELPALPDGLKRLDLQRARVASLAGLPPSVDDLNLSWTDVDPAQVSSLSNLRTLVWRGYPKKVLEPLPAGLKRLDLEDSPGLHQIDHLPPGLVELDISFTGVTSLPKPLPESLRVLRVRGLPELPLQNLPPLTTLAFTVSDGPAECPPPSVKRLEIYDR